MAVDRARLRVRAGAGDADARRALAITGRTSFMLSGAQLGITVTGLVVGYVAEPLIGAGLGELLGGVGVPTGVGVAIGTVAALLFATVVQMVFGELFPKNLAIARPEPVARALALSTSIYLTLFGWLIRLFDASSNLLLRALRIEPVHDVEHSATPRDLEAIIDESRERGDLRADLSAVLDRVLEFEDRPARAAMIPRPRVATAPADATVGELVRRMAAGHSRYPVLADGADDVVGVVCLRDVLALPEEQRDAVAGARHRPPGRGRPRLAAPARRAGGAARRGRRARRRRRRVRRVRRRAHRRGHRRGTGRRDHRRARPRGHRPAAEQRRRVDRAGLAARPGGRAARGPRPARGRLPDRRRA